jgi:hypothetical protein
MVINLNGSLESWRSELLTAHGVCVDVEKSSGSDGTGVKRDARQETDDVSF